MKSYNDHLKSKKVLIKILAYIDPQQSFRFW